jgi:MFS family permease
MNYMSNIWKLYAIRFFHNLIPAYVIERLFWEQRGMTIQMVVYTEIIYAITVVLLEIPTGIIADKWGRKRMMMLNAFFGCCEFMILIFANEFWHFAAAVFLAGIGRAACSGSENAILFDSLVSAGMEQQFEKSVGRLNVVDFAAVIIASLYGSIIAVYFGFEPNYWLSVGAMLVSLFISFSLIEPMVPSKAEKSTAIKEYIIVSFMFFKDNPCVCIVLLAGMVIGACMNFLDEFWQLYLSRLGIRVEYYGVFITVLVLLRLPGNMLASVMKSRFSYRNLLSGVLLVFTAGFLSLAIFRGYTGLAVISLIGLSSGIIEPLVSGYLHHRISDSSMRATLDSFQSLGLRAVLVIVGLGFGYFSSRYEIFGGYGFIAVICAVFLVCFRIITKKVKG